MSDNETTSGTGTPTVPVPNIPLPKGTSAGLGTSQGRSLGTSLRGTPITSPPGSAATPSFPSSAQGNTDGKRPRARSNVSSDGLGRKSPISMTDSQNKVSGISARLATSPNAGPVAGGSEPISRSDSAVGNRADMAQGGNTGGANTPVTGGAAGESSFSNLADVPDEEKARVLGRHLMSARERRGSAASRTPYSAAASPGVSAGVYSGGMRAEQQGRTMSRTSNPSLKTPGAEAGGKAKNAGDSAVEDAPGSAGGSATGEGDYGAMGESFHIPYEAHGVDVT